MSKKNKNNTPKNKRLFTLKKENEFLKCYAESGNITKSAEHAGINREYIYRAKDKHKGFSEKMEALKPQIVGMLRDEAWDLIKLGTKQVKKIEEIVDGKLQVVRIETTESPKLSNVIMKLLSVHDDEWKQKDEPQAPVINLTIRESIQDEEK